MSAMLRNGKIVTDSTNSADDLFRTQLPEKEPYEGKATQKQKQLIWELGFREESIIDELGKKQASFLIDKLKRHRRIQRGTRSGKGMLKFGVVLLSSAVASLFLPRVMPFLRESDSFFTLAMLSFFGGIFFVLFGAYRYVSSKL